MLERFQDAATRLDTQDLIFVAIELGVVLLFFLALGWVLRRLLLGIARMERAERFSAILTGARKNLRALNFLGWLAASLAVLGFNAWLLLQGSNGLRAATLERFRAIPDEVWTTLAIGAVQVVALVIVTALVLRVVKRLLSMIGAWVDSLENLSENDEAVDQFFTSLTTVVVRATWLFVLAVSVRLLGAPAAITDVFTTLVKVYLTIGVGLVLWRALDAIIESLDALSQAYSREDNLLRFYSHFQHLVPLFRKALEWVIYLSVAGLVARQIDPISGLAEWGGRLVSIIGVMFFAAWQSKPRHWPPKNCSSTVPNSTARKSSAGAPSSR